MQRNAVNKSAAKDTVANTADKGQHARSLYIIVAFQFVIAFKVRTAELMELGAPSQAW
jgi:hypothetical protein